MDINQDRQAKVLHIGQLLPEQLQQPVPFEMVDLTEQEKELALKEAMVKKHAKLEEDRKKRLAEEKKNDWRRPWTPNELYEFARMRATQLLRYETGNMALEFEPVEFQRSAITALSLYFSNSEIFENLDSKNYSSTGLKFSLQKGLWLWSNPGLGKTLMMQMFSRNKRLCYQVVQCPKIVAGYVKDGDQHISHYSQLKKSLVKEYQNFFQEEMGICYNDLGTETPLAKHYGTPINVMESILLDTYENRVPFFHRHVTTNLTFDQVKEKYGVRVTDRIKQCFNIIEIKGTSLRK